MTSRRNESKIRELWYNQNDGKVAYKDIVDLFIESHDKIQQIEYEDSPHALKAVISVNLRAMKMLKDFHKRIKEEIEPEILEAYSLKPKKKIGDPNKIIEANNKRHGRNDPLRH